MVLEVQAFRQPDRLRDILRGRRRGPHPATADQIAERFAHASASLSAAERRGVVVVDRRDGWLVRLREKPGMREQQQMWSFTPDGRLCRFPISDFRLGWDHYLEERQIDARLARYADPLA